jgi:prolipoprotein diacylglyceryl transferase
MNFLWNFEPSAAAFTLGTATIHWYGITLAVGAGLGMALTLFLVHRYRLAVESSFDVLLGTILVGFLGARLYHVLNEAPYYWKNPGEIIQIWHGGLAIHGALLFGGLAFFILARRAKLPLGRLADCVAPGLLLAQAIGRWGNYFNQELFGGPTNRPWGIPIDPQFRPLDALGATHFHPVFLYESILDVLGVIVLLIWHRRELRQKPEGRGRSGRIFFLYLLLMGSARFIAELFRFDPTPGVFGLRLPLLVSAGCIIAGTFFLIRYSYGKSHAR